MILHEKKNIIFDLGNVVVDIDLNITMERFRKLGFKKEGDFLNKYQQIGIFNDFEEGRVSAGEFVEGLKAYMKAGVTDEEIIEAWNVIIGDYKEDRIETILKLKETHGVYLLSNTNELHVEVCENKVPLVGSLNKLFNKTYYSHEMGMSKPNRNIFEALLKDAGIKAEETLFLDDSKANVEAARKLGIESWLVEYPDQWVPRMKALIKER
ncbi:HAD family hydrolase [Plebeiibacterium marinum]|uniref:HAD family phosphatase n=1 Tax=Plebeiibacterium marinum TaxID=2992111 RepID=A0AAE3MHV4_9BACT|nr:HAD family phosphatase [Plebeiobacterium marinum]MCW3807927.1 HAD family phosphatase [Plebeiobacterium marinum]